MNDVDLPSFDDADAGGNGALFEYHGAWLISLFDQRRAQQPLQIVIDFRKHWNGLNERLVFFEVDFADMFYYLFEVSSLHYPQITLRQRLAGDRAGRPMQQSEFSERFAFGDNVLLSVVINAGHLATFDDVEEVAVFAFFEDHCAFWDISKRHFFYDFESGLSFQGVHEKVFENALVDE